MYIGSAILIFCCLFIIVNVNFFVQHILYYGRRNTNKSVLIVPSKRPALAKPNLVIIPSLNITAPIVYATSTTEQNFQANLKNGVVHYPGTALPGQAGNCYIFGHSSDYLWSNGKYKTVFATLPHMSVGDSIEVTDPNGFVYIYTVTETKIVSPTALEYLHQDYTKKMLTVQTSYPVGTALERFLVIAELQT